VCALRPDGLDPGVSLLGAAGTDGVGLVLPLHHPAVRLRLTRLDLLPSTVGVVQLQAVLDDTGETQRLIEESRVRRLERGVRGTRSARRCDATAGGRRTGLRGNGTSRTHRFSRGMMPRGSLSCTRRDERRPSAQSREQRVTGVREPTAWTHHHNNNNWAEPHGGELKVVEAVVSQDEPAPLPRLHPAA